jgi:hypothetical protein
MARMERELVIRARLDRGFGHRELERLVVDKPVH